MPVHQLSHRGRSEPVSAVGEGRLVDDEALNMIWLKNTISAEATSVTFLLLALLARIPVLSQIIL